jgi:putative ABC transport system permease protein
MSRWDGLFNRRKRMMEDLDQDIGDFIERETQDNIERGLAPEEAHYAALRKFGNVTRVQEDTREVWSLVWLEQLWQDIRYGLRVLAKSPGFTAAAVLTLALGIGANIAIFSVVNAVLVRPLPYRDAGRLVMLWSTEPKNGWRGQASPLDFVTWRQESRCFESLAAFQPDSRILTGRGEPVRLSGGQISAGFFETLGIAPQLGRTFAPAEYRPGGERVALIAHGLWQERFGSDPGIIGRSVRLSDEIFTVVGVMPDALQFPIDGLKFWLPLELNEAQPDDRHFFFVVARLKDGKGVAEAQTDVATIAGRLEKQFPGSHAGYGAAVVPLRESFTGAVRPALALLSGAVGMLLLIVCGNVASLLLARATARGREIAVRLALGASRWRLTRTVLTESLLLALAGGALGVALAYGGIRLLLASLPTDLPLPSYLKTVALDSRVLAFMLLLCVIAGLISGLLPALRSSRHDPYAALKEGAGTTTAGLRQLRLRGTLIVAELALTSILLVAAGLLMQNAVRLQRTDPGLRPDHVLVMDVALPQARYREPQERVAFYRDALDRIRSLAGVRYVGAVNDLPFRNWTGFTFTIEGHPTPAPGEVPEALERVASPDYFRAMGIPVLKGRAFTDGEGPSTMPVVMVNAALVRRYFPGEDPVGRRLRPGGPDEPGAPWYTIVGVVGNVRHLGMVAAPSPEIYTLQAQDPWRGMTIVVRTEPDPWAMAAAVKNQLWAVDPDLPISGMASMTQVLSDSLWPSRILTYLQGIFAAIALLVASVGLYAVVSQSVTLRRHEFGVRLAVGAEPAQILRLVLSQGLKLILLGMGVGLLGAIALARSLTALLPVVSPTDPWTFAAAALLLAVVALTACWQPARRAARVDPMVALRYE